MSARVIVRVEVQVIDAPGASEPVGHETVGCLSSLTLRNRIGVRDNLSHGVVARRARALDERQARKLLGVRECTGCGLAGLNRDAGAPPGETMQSNGLLLPPLPAEG